MFQVAESQIEHSPLVKEWHRFMRAEGISPRTLAERSRVMRRFTEWVNGDPETASSAQVADWFSYHYERWSPSTRATYYGHLKAFYRWLIVMEYREDDPLARIRRPRAPRTEPRPVADEHMPRLVAAANRRKTRAMVLLAALAGLRVSEVAKVRGEDFDLRGGQLRVVGKGGVMAYVAIHPQLADMALQMPRRGPWFPTGRGNKSGRDHILSHSVSDLIADVMRRASVPGTPHSLRHWFGTTLIDDGADMRTVQELLRHASLQTVQIYTKVRSAKKTEAVGRLNIYRGAGDHRLSLVG